MNNKPQLNEYLDMSEFTRPVTDVKVPPQDMILVGGDFSGIQKYIYKIASKQAGRSLKGRSFYLHLLSDSIVRFLLKRLGLTKDSVVYDSGGSFYLTAPDTEETCKIIEEAALDIERCLFDAHGTDLYLALDYVKLPKDALLHKNGQDLRKVWTELFNRRRVQKNRKFSRLITSDSERFFTPTMHGSPYKRDSVTGEELYKGASEDSNGLYLSPITHDQIEVGKALQTNDCMLVTETPIKEWNDLTHVIPALLGFTYYFIKSFERMKWLAKAGNAKVEQETIKGTVKWVKTFEEICKGERLDRMGVLRMDVDNLGMLFQQGIPAESATLERYKSLSHKFAYFFSDYLHEIQREEAPDSSLVIYSGGDDVFIVGAWDHTIALAKRIREDFRIYTKGNPRFSISGGVAIVKDKFPIMKGAEESANEEHLAKEHKVNTTDGRELTKNSISFLHTPLNWDTEFRVVEDLKNNLLELLRLKKDALDKSFLSKVMIHATNAKIKNHRVTHFKTYWLLTYDLSRMCERTHNESVRTIINHCIKEVCKNDHTLDGNKIETNYHPLELWSFACRWAELEYRTREETNEKIQRS